VQRPVGLDEGVLRGLLGIGGVAGDQDSGAECDLLVAADELRVGVRVPALRALDQLVLCQWSAHHCSLLQRRR
jgi:hypothetical protein